MRAEIELIEMVPFLPIESAKRLQSIHNNIPPTQILNDAFNLISAVTYFVLETKHISLSLSQLVEINSIQYIVVVRLFLWFSSFWFVKISLEVAINDIMKAHFHQHLPLIHLFQLHHHR